MIFTLLKRGDRKKMNNFNIPYLENYVINKDGNVHFIDENYHQKIADAVETTRQNVEYRKRKLRLFGKL